MNKEGNGYKCPKCGAEGKYHGEHYAAFRQIKSGKITVVNVGWRCWNCGHEWGFQEESMLTDEEIREEKELADMGLEDYLQGIERDEK